MMKKNYFILMALMAMCLSLNAQNVERVEPLCWWTNMKMPLTLMLHGEDLKDCQVVVLDAKGSKPAKGLKVMAVRNAESPNYLFVDMKVLKAGNYMIQVVGKQRKRELVPYTISERRTNPAANTSYGPEDVIYLLMPDRFANGNPNNDNTDDTAEKAARSEWFGRHGGDIQGIINHLDDIKKLGATAIWSTPLLLDNESTQSYHGYACADYYHIDPRFGSNLDYLQLALKCHEKGLKLIMDIVPNHCGGAHWWMKDLPYHDWIHQFPEFTRSNWQFSVGADPHVAKVDFDGMNSGWFDTSMPDMNLDNPDLLKYFQQWAIWWIEYANLDGLRVDTYPYNEKVPMSQWCKAVRNEYPGINIVGECWTRPSSQVAYWQADAFNHDGFNSNLPCVMDFPLQEAIVNGLKDDGSGWEQGLHKVYSVLADDYLYAHPDNLLIFDGNHDTPRIKDVLKDQSNDRNKIVISLLATMRGIPQLTYGEEIGLQSLNQQDLGNHGALRVDYPGYWPGETQTLNAEQKDLLSYYTQLLNWRKTEPIIHKGKLMHFLARDNTYAYFRYTDEGAIFVYLNASESEKQIPWERYQEIASKYAQQGTNVMTGETVDFGKEVTVPGLGTLIVKLKK